jgi:hypothetical protein
MVQVAESALLDVMMLAHADVLVGSFSSHFSSAALELSTALKGYVPPYVRSASAHPPMRARERMCGDDHMFMHSLNMSSSLTTCVCVCVCVWHPIHTHLCSRWQPFQRLT